MSILFKNVSRKVLISFFIVFAVVSMAVIANSQLLFATDVGGAAHDESTTGDTGDGESTTGDAGDGESTTGDAGLVNPAKYKDVCELVGAILTIIAELAAVVGVIFIIWSGFLFVMAQGNVTKLEAAKRTFYTTIIGMAIILGASVITRIIFKTVQSVTAAEGGVSICNVK